MSNRCDPYEADDRFFRSMCEIFLEAESDIKKSVKDGLEKSRKREEQVEKKEKELVEFEQRIKNLIGEYDKRVEKIKRLREFQKQNINNNK